MTISRKSKQGKKGKPSAPLQSANTRQQLNELVRHVWNSSALQYQAQLLTFDLKLLYARSRYIPGQPQLEQVLVTGMQRLHSTGSMQQWKWHPDQETKTFDNPQRFKRACEHHKLPKPARDCLEALRSRPSSAAAKQGLHNRMKAIQQKVAAHKQAQADLSKSKPWRLTRQSMLINIVFAELLSEHELLYLAFAAPIVRAIWEVAPKHIRDPEPPTECEGALLDFVNIDVAGHADAANVTQINNWVEQKVALMCKLTQKGYNAEVIEVQPFKLASTEGSSSLTLSERWLQHLQQQRTLSSKAGDSGGDNLTTSSSEAGAASSDAVVDWVYSSSVEPFRSAQLPGSQQTTPAPAACEQLIRVLKEVATVLEGLDQIEELITDLKQMRPLPASHYPARGKQARQFPPRVVWQMIQHEYLFKKANACLAGHNVLNGTHRQFKLRQQLNQTFDTHHLRLGAAQARLSWAEVAQAQYTHLNVTEQAIEQHAMALLYSDPNSSDHQRAHVGKALIDERELNDKAMKDVAAAIEILTNKSKAADAAQAELVSALRSYTAWGDQVTALVAAMGDLNYYFNNHAASRSAELEAQGPSLPQQRLKQLCQHFHEDLLPKLQSPEQRAGLLRALEAQHVVMVEHFDAGHAVTEALRSQVVDAACHDPAALILPHIVQSLLRDRLEAKAETHQVRQVGKSQRSLNDPGNESDWDPKFAALSGHYWQCLGGASRVSGDDHIGRLRQDVVSMYNHMSLVSTESYISFADDLLLQEVGAAPPDGTSLESTMAEGTLFGFPGSDLDITMCLTAVFMYPRSTSDPVTVV